MKFEQEITVEVDTSLEELIKILESNNYRLLESYDLDDIYMVNKSDKDIENYLELLNKCVLLRHLNEELGEKNMVVYKYKEYGDNEEITKQGKVKCFIDNLENAKLLFEKLNFIELITINNHSLVYSNGEDEMVIQLVNDKHIYIEIEDENQNKTYNSIDEMKDVLNKLNIPIKGEDYFVKKALIELNEKYGKKEC